MSGQKTGRRLSGSAESDHEYQGRPSAVNYVDERAHLGFRRAPGADLAPPPAPRRGQAEGATQAAHRAAAQGQGLHLLELFGEVAVVHPRVGPLQELSRPRPDLGGQAAGGRPAPQAMEQAAGPLGGEEDLHPLKLLDAEVQGQRPLRIADLPGQGGLEQPGPRHFLAAHRECLPCRHGVTFLRNS